MKQLSCDIETFSSTNLIKSGVYRYSESDDFEVLLFGYSVDGGPVQVVDLTQGEQIPDDIREALTDRSVLKWAFNAAFERVCLSRFLGLPQSQYLDPSSWRCTMVWAATLGLPLSLEGVGAVLGLDKQKLKEGKDLIRYFCSPGKLRDGTPVRHYPRDASEKWEFFKAYNIRDVETEIALQQKLAKFPVSCVEWRNYHLDQEINDRGIMLDMQLVRQAVRCDEQFKKTHLDMAREVTGLENPNSTFQMKAWLAEQGMETDSLSKASVLEMLDKAEGTVELALSLRQELAKSSVRKFTAMENAVCRDQRARGLFQFYGANRTGRWCLTGDHEVLTPHGWKKIDSDFNGRPEIAVYDSRNGIIHFERCKIVNFVYQGDMYLWDDKRVSQLSTPEHRNLITDSSGITSPKYVAEIPTKVKLPVCGSYKSSVRKRFTDAELRLLVAYQADGIAAGGRRNGFAFRFTKTRKIERMRSLLNDAGYKYSEYLHSGGVTCFRIRADDYNHEIKTKQFGWWLINEDADVFFSEIGYWDGHIETSNSIQYATTNRLNAEIVATFAHLSGRASIVNTKNYPQNPKRNTAFYVQIWNNVQQKGVSIPSAPNLQGGFSGKVFCARTTTGYFLTRRSDKIWVTGNSGRILQPQNLPATRLTDIETARQLIRAGCFDSIDILYDSVPIVLSELIRTAFIPKPGNRFFVADFSAIEARVIAWIAGEEWRVEVFERGEDIYCASASQMFHVPVEKHGTNGHLRQKGKIAELACIAENSLVLTNKGLVPIQSVEPDMLLWDGCEWVKHEGVILKGTKEIIEYEGLRATPDHLVWVEEELEPVWFGYAAACGAHLIQTGDGRQAIWLGESQQFGQAPKALLINRSLARVYDIRNAGPQHCFTVSGKLVHNCGYGGSVGALKAMGALELGVPENELSGLIHQWRSSNPSIVQLWWDVDRAVKACTKDKVQTETHRIRFLYQSGFLFIVLPSGRCLAYVKPRIGENRFGGESVTYEGTASMKKWDRIESYGPKFVENIVQATARDILAESMLRLAAAGYRIVMHVHDEVVIEAPATASLNDICAIMGQTPAWAKGLLLRADGFICDYYRKD